MSLVEQARKRAQEILEKIRTRRLLAGQSITRSSEGQVIGGLIGGGKVIENIGKSLDNLVALAKERRPNIIPTVMERIKAFEPGKRIKELLPPLGEGTTTTTTTTGTGTAPTGQKITRE